MNHKLKVALSYIVVPIIITIIGYTFIYIATKPVIEMVSAVGSMVLSKSAPTFSSDLNSIFDENTIKASDEVDNKEITIPANETHYANILCDRIELEAPVYFGDTDKVLKNGVGQSISSFMPGNGKPILIGGHDSTFFAPLENIIEGDIIKIVTNYGVYEYKVTGTYISDEVGTGAYNLSQDKEQLILYTCYPFGTVVGVKNQKYFVYADKVSGPDIVVKEQKNE